MSDYESSILQELSSIGQAIGSAAPVDPVAGNEQIAAAPSPDDYEASIFKELSGLNPNAGAVPRTPQKQVDIHPDALSSLVISAQRGAGANRDFEKDLTTLDDADLVKIYGQGADALRSQMYNELKAQQKTLNADRTTAQVMGDTINKAAQGAISFIGGGLALSAGAGNYVGGKINDGLGIEDNATTNFADSVAPAISEATTAAVGWLNGFTSDQTQETDRLVALQTDYESGVNKAERDAAVAAGGNSTIETMKMVGKNFLDGGAEILNNPTATSNLIAGALGSLGPSAKVVGSVAKMVESTGTYKAAQLAAAIDNTGMGKILGMAADATKAGATAGAVGLTEAAGTYQQTLQEVLDMPEEDLMKSAEYFHLVENGMNPAQARTQVAERTAREAFFTALPLATASSIMALKFDANPLKAMGDAGFQNGLAGIGREVLGQTVEEALQSGSSEFSRNKAFQENIDPAQELFTGVGEQAAAGAIGGAGMAGVLGIPSAAGAVGNIAADNLSGPAAPSGPTPFGPNDPNSPSSLDPAMSAALLDKAQSDIAKMEGQVGPLTEYQQEMLRVLRSNQDNPDNLYQLYVLNDRSPAAEKAFNESLNDITPNALSTFVDTAKAKAGDAAAAAKDLYSKVSAGAAEGFAKAKEAVVEKANEINTKQTPEAAAETVQAAANSVVAVYDWNTQTGQDAPEGIKQATAPKAEDVPTELQSTLSSAPDLVSTVSSLVQNLTTGAIKVKDLSNDGLLYAHDHIEKLRAALPTMPKDVQESVKAMLNSPSVAKIQARVKGLDLSTKVGNSVSAIKRMVRINPTKVDPTEVAKILEQRDRTDLTDEDIRLMKAAAKISSALDNHAGNKVQIGKDEIVDFTKPVNAPILDNQNARVSRNLQVEGFNGLRSINDYASDIFRAAQSGNPEGAVDAAGNIYSGIAVAGEYGNFTQHLINKVEALNQSHDADGKFVQFESLNAKSRKMIPAGQAGGAKAVAHHPGNPGSTKNAQAVYNDAKAAVEVYNTLVETFPEMFPDGKKTLPVLKLTPPNQAKAEPKPAQPEAKPKVEAKAEGEADQAKEKMVYWNGIGLYLSIFEKMEPEELKVEEVSPNAGMFQFAYITKNGERLVGTFDYNDYEGFLDNFVITSENGANKVGLSRIRDIGIKLLSQFPKASGIAGDRLSGARINDENSEPVPVIFDLKDGRLVLRQEKSQVSAPKERKATAEEVAQIQDLFKAAYGDLKFPALPVIITDVIDEKENYQGWMGHNGTMKLVPAVFENKDNMKKATHIVFHELGHWVDWYGEYPVSDSKDWTKAVAEFDAFVDNVANETQKRFLSYILSHRGKDTYASEVFADLFSIMGTRPDFVSKNFPLAQKLMTEALNEATGNTAKPNEKNKRVLGDGTIITDTTITAPDGTVFKYGPMEYEHTSMIMQTIAEVYGLVFYQFIKDGTTELKTMTEGVSVAAMYDEDTGILYIHEDILKGFGKDDAQSLHVVFHEIGHVLDSLYETHGISGSDAFSKRQGEIEREIADVVQDLDSFTSLLLTSYALQHRDRETRVAETFAELFSVFTYSPETIQKELPLVYAFFKELIEKYSNEDYEKTSRASRLERHRAKTGTGNSTNQQKQKPVTPTSPDPTEDVLTPVKTPEVDVPTDTIMDDTTGLPVVFFHGTNKKFDKFNDGEIFLTNKYSLAAEHALRDKMDRKNLRVIGTNVVMTNPLVLDAGENDPDIYYLQNASSIKEQVASGDHDGILISNNKNEAVGVVFNSSQITQIEYHPKTKKQIFKAPAAERNSLFTKVFTESKEPAPFTSVDDVIAQVNELGDHMGVFTNFLQANVGPIVKRLNARLGQVKFNNDSEDTVIEAFKKDPEKVLLYRDFKNLAFVDPVTRQYDPTIAALAVVFVLDELSNAHPAPPSLLKDRMEEDEIDSFQSEQQQIDYMQSISIRVIAENLARDLPTVLGLKINDDARLGDVRGSLEGLIKEILVSIAETNDGGLLRISDVPTKKGDTQAIVLSDTMKDLQKRMGLDGRSGMSKVIFPENIQGPTLNEPPAFVAQKQSHGGIETSTTEREALKNMQSIGHQRTSVASLLKFLGPDVMFTILGGKDVSHLAENHPLRRSIEGKNLSIKFDYDDAMFITNTLEEAGSDSKVYYSTGITRMGRHQMEGPNPQNNKILRHSATPTFSLLNMRDNPEHQDFFWLTVAQAFGLKVEKKSHDFILNTIENDFRLKYKDAIYLAREFLITGEMDRAQFQEAILGINMIPEGSILPADSKIVHDIDTETTMAIIDAVMAVAALDEARAEGKEEEFVTSLAFEIDGLTNGPANMMVNMGQGILTVSDYENLRRVGYFLGERNMTTNTYYVQQGNKDLYELTTQFAEASMILSQTNALKMKALARFASRFGDFQIVTGPDGGKAYMMTRNTAKSPVTKKGYGSGVGGISKAISKDMVLEFYRFMVEDQVNGPELDLNYPEFAKDFKVLFNTEFNPETDWTRSIFDQKSLAHFNTLVEDTLGRVLSDSAEKLIGNEITKVTSTLVFLSNIQTTYLQFAFEHRARAILVARGADPNKHIRYQDLTVSEMRQLVSDLRALAPAYFNGDQTLGLASFDNEISERTELSSTMDGRLRMKSSLPMPADAGVRIIPILNIGRGDAMVMNIAYGREDFPTRSIPIYDGVSLAIADIGAYSDLINEAVAENWNQDLLGPVLQDVIRFSQSVPANEQELLEMAYYVAAKMQPKSIKFQSLEDVVKTLERMVEFNQARKTVFAKIPRSVNQMAGADRTINLGPEGFMDRDEINVLIAEEMRNPTPKAEEEPADPKNQFSNLSVMTGMEMLRALLSTVKNPRLVEVLKTLVKANPNVRVITGNAAQIAAHRLDEGADPVLTTRKGSGFFDEKNQTIYLVSKNHETLVHELIHFTTFALVHKVYAGEGSPVQRDAVSRLEKLMGEFMEMDFSKASKAAQRAAKSAKAQILGHQANNDAWSQAAALNEFMAWSLANEALRRELGNTLADGVLRFVKTVKALMARLLGAVSYDMFSNVLFNTRAILEPDLTQEPAAVDPKTNEPAPSASVEEALTGEVVVDEDVEGVIFGQGGMLVPYNGGNGNLIGGGSGSGGNGGNGGNGSSQDPSGMPQYNNFWINLLRTKLNDVRNAPVRDLNKSDQMVRYMRNTQKSFNMMLNGGFQFTEEQRLTFEAIHMILALEVQLDARALQSMGKVFNHVVENLRPEMFTGEAQDKYQSFMDALGKTTNDEQISDAIATFFAMSQTNDEFRFVLEQLPKPADKKASSFSEFVSTMTVSLMRKAVGSINPDDKNARDAMDMLSRVILAQDTKEEFRILRLLMRSFDVADKYTSGKLRQMSDLVSDYAYNLPDEQRMKKKIAESVALVTNLFSDQRADLTYEFVKTITHNGNTFDDFIFLRELVAEMIGTDKNNEKIVALMDVVKKQVSALREGHRDNVPLTLQGNFQTKPTAEQWAVAHAVLAKTDFSALFDLQYADQTMSLISDPAYRARQIRIYSDTIKRELSRSAALTVLDKSQQLADFMNGNGAGFQLLRNAFAINEIEGDKSKPGLVTAIDKLVSLLALDGKTPEELQTISDMYEADPDAMKSVLVYMKKLNQNEDEKLQVSETILTDEYGDEYDYDPVHRMRMNGYKGYVPNLGNPDVTITVEDDAYRTILEKRGFIRVGDYTADDMVSVASKGYYVSSTRQNGGYAQGVMQSIQNTYRGVNAGTGITVNGTTSGIIMGYENLDRVISAYNRAGMVADPKETLLPVYDGDSVIYYERALNPDLVEKYTQPAGNLALQLGVWSGRQVEEKAAQSYNALLIDQLKAVWDNREPGSDGLFIDIRGEYYAWIKWERADKEERRTMRKPDAIYADSWKVIPPQTKAYIAGVFGEDGFMVRRDQINTALGYAEPSIADFWTGKTRFSEDTASVVRAVANMTLGRLKSGTSALTLLQTAAGGIQETVSFAKDLIVTRSLVVPYLNNQANIFTLNLRGVPNKMIVTGYRDKLIEIEQYNQNFKKIMFLNTQYDLAEGDTNKQGIIRREIQVLKDQNRRMSIHPLVEAGAYKNISEGITEEDFEILKSGLAALVEKQVDRLPDIAKTIVRNGLVSQTTDIYRVANKAVQYGDFLAKGVYFDYLTKIQGMSEEAALSRINEEYVNFSTPPGRVRSALDKYGATWFMTYKIRIAKVAMAQARQNPVRALLVNTLDEGGRNTAQHSNLFANMLDGSIEYSLGWEMMMNSPGLNPWLNMLDW